MIPLRDENPTSRPAVVTYALIGLNLFVFFFVQPTLAGGSADERSARQLEFFVCRSAIANEVTSGRPLADADPETVSRDGRVIGEFQRSECPGKNVWLSVFVSMFLHGGFLHIAGNMVFLFVFGNNVEDRLGAAKFVAFYLLCGIIAALAQILLTPSSVVPLVGASGAIAGVLGAYLLMFPHARVKTLVFIVFFVTIIEMRAIVLLGLWFVMQLFQGVGDVSPGSGGVAYAAHIGGFVAGMVLLALFRPRRPPAPARAQWPY